MKCSVGDSTLELRTLWLVFEDIVILSSSN